MHSSLFDLLAEPSLSRLIDNLAKQLKQKGEFGKTTTINNLKADERSALNRLTGHTYRQNANIKVGELRLILERVADGQTLEELIESVAGETFRSDRLNANQLKQDWKDVFEHTRMQVMHRPELAAWVDSQQRSRSWKSGHSPTTAGELLLQTITLVDAALGACGTPILLAEFAARHCGDAHALDHGKSLTRLFLTAAAAVSDLPAPGTSAERRAVWNAIGIVPDELSSTVLVWNLRSNCDSLTAQILNAHADAGEPARLTLATLRRHPLSSVTVPTNCVVSVCENPCVMERAARDLETDGGPLVCTEGQPGVAVMWLLAVIVASGCTLRYHGDFDWGGIHIANRLWRDVPELQPWRFLTQDYVRHANEAVDRLNGDPVTATWDAELSQAMARRGAILEEELVLDELMADLLSGLESA